MNTRMEHDTMGEVTVPAGITGAPRPGEPGKLQDRRPAPARGIITAFAYLKEACARGSADCGKLTAEQAGGHRRRVRRIGRGGMAEFPWWCGRPAAAFEPA